MANWLKPVSQDQDDKALALIAKLNALAICVAMPTVFINVKLNSILFGLVLIILLPQLIVINLANTFIIAGKQRTGIEVSLKEFLTAMLSAVLMYADIFLLVNYMVNSTR